MNCTPRPCFLAFQARASREVAAPIPTWGLGPRACWEQQRSPGRDLKPRVSTWVGGEQFEVLKYTEGCRSALGEAGGQMFKNGEALMGHI